MTLPGKSTSKSFPKPRKLTVAAHSAIADDKNVEFGVRVAVLINLEGAPDPKIAFESICKDEELKGPKLPSTLTVGRAMTLESFELGLTSGWFGADPMDASISRSLIDALRPVILEGNTDTLATLRAYLDPGSPSPILFRRVTWYYYDEKSPLDPLHNVASDLAHRLALPCVWGKLVTSSDPIEFIVFAIPWDLLDDPRKPRFTDCGNIEFLDIWRPGGKTAPWVSGYIGLDEAVDIPSILGITASGVKITFCFQS